MSLATVQDVLNEARVLLLDGVSPFRYSDEELIRALNIAVLTAVFLRKNFTNTGVRYA